jgi:cell division transport system permease protein
MLRYFKKKDRRLGVSVGKRTYDLPLDSGAGTQYLKILVILMTVLAVFAFATSFVLSDMTDRWASGLENKATIEFPIQEDMSREELRDRMAKAQLFLKNQPAIASVTIMSEQEVQKLVSPWLGDSPQLDDFPLPGLISLVLVDRENLNIPLVERELKAIHESARLDTHDSWLENILHFTGALQFSAYILLLTVAGITIVAVAGAVSARIAVHQEAVELLHLIGASDGYITSQFQKHTFLLSFIAAVIGVAIGCIALLIIGWLSGKMDVALLPDFTMHWSQKAVFLILPVIIAVLAALTARFTVLHALRRMP